MDITKIIELIMLILMSGITYFLVPYLKAKYGEIKVQKAYEIIKILVNAVEQVTTVTGAGTKKKQEVIKKFKKYNIEINDEQISDLIESAVLELNNSIKGSDVND